MPSPHSRLPNSARSAQGPERNPPAPQGPSVRHDPRARPVDGVAAWARVENKRSDRRYVLVYVADTNSMANYEAAGWEPELWREDGPYFAGTRSRRGELGKEMVVRGYLLMSVSDERYREIQEFGPDGDTGYELARRVERRIIDRRTENDPIRGDNGDLHIGFENETSGEQFHTVQP